MSVSGALSAPSFVIFIHAPALIIAGRGGCRASWHAQQPRSGAGFFFKGALGERAQTNSLLFAERRIADGAAPCRALRATRRLCCGGGAASVTTAHACSFFGSPFLLRSWFGRAVRIISRNMGRCAAGAWTGLVITPIMRTDNKLCPLPRHFPLPRRRPPPRTAPADEEQR